MVFSSSVFLFLFLPITLALYYLINPRYRNFILMTCSLFFYAGGEPHNVFLMLISIVVNFALGLLMENGGSIRKKGCLITAIIFNLGLLFFFKYFNFFIDIVNGIFRSSIVVDRIALPIGISFFTFQIMSYVIDVYRGEVHVQHNIIDLALYISLFPQLIAGPIVRYIDVEEQMNHRIHNVEKFYSGVMMFMKGFSKKVLIADQMAPLADAAFSNIGSSVLLSWAGIIAYTLQIYFDFSGYSDMAVGLGRMFGFEFVQNFNFPYISKSIKEFWRRWHISLSTWFRDYVYIPLGGNRKGTVRTYINLLTVFFLTGLWHGASFNFIVWGLFYGVFLVAERVGLGVKLAKLPNMIQHIYTLAIVLIGWVFFRANNLTDALLYIKSMFVVSGTDWVGLIANLKGNDLFCIVVGIILSCPYPKLRGIVEQRNCLRIGYDVISILVFLLAICFMVGTGFSPFLYFRF